MTTVTVLSSVGTAKYAYALKHASSRAYHDPPILLLPLPLFPPDQTPFSRKKEDREKTERKERQEGKEKPCLSPFSVSPQYDGSSPSTLLVLQIHAIVPCASCFSSKLFYSKDLFSMLCSVADLPGYPIKRLLESFRLILLFDTNRSHVGHLPYQNQLDPLRKRPASFAWRLIRY